MAKRLPDVEVVTPVSIAHAGAALARCPHGHGPARECSQCLGVCATRIDVPRSLVVGEALKSWRTRDVRAAAKLASGEDLTAIEVARMAGYSSSNPLQTHDAILKPHFVPGAGGKHRRYKAERVRAWLASRGANISADSSCVTGNSARVAHHGDESATSS